MKTRTLVAAVSVSCAMALVLAGCAQAPAKSVASQSKSKIVPCLVSTVGGFNDESFNQLNLEGMQEAATKLGVSMKKAQSDTSDAYAGNINSMISQGCTVIETLGFDMIGATKTAALANPKVDFIMVDSTLEDAKGNALSLPNVKPIIFQTGAPSYLAGYLAAGVSKSGKVGVYGGVQIPPVVDFMDGFAQGVAEYNTVHSTSVKVVGWNSSTQTGLFVGNFTDQNAAKNLSQGLFDQGVDVIMPVAGELFEGTEQAIQANPHSKIALIGVNTDGYEIAPDFKSLYLTSVLKNMANATRDVVLQIAKSGFNNKIYNGTIANDGVGIAPYHGYSSTVTPALQKEITDLRTKLTNGTIAVK